ncbi:30S ribosomal protein S2 [Patescibacteria group bacterium]|nr:30S ribosomal protein S2 [Patescibacteria group bacterium]
MSNETKKVTDVSSITKESSSKAAHRVPKEELKKEETLNSTLKVPRELQELLEAGVHFGHKKSAVHPGMFPYIFGVRNNVHIFDVEKTYEKLGVALEYIKDLIREGKTILFVGTRVPVRDMVRATAQEVNMPYVITYWAGGLLTNWNVIQERVQHMKDLRLLQKSEEWSKHTKHERLKLTRELHKLEERWEGIQDMEKPPEAIFVVDMYNNALAAREAQKQNISVIALVDTNINPAGADYVIPANDDSISSVRLILGKVKDAIESVQSKTKTKKSKAATSPESKSSRATKK